MSIIMGSFNDLKEASIEERNISFALVRNSAMVGVLRTLDDGGQHFYLVRLSNTLILVEHTNSTFLMLEYLGPIVIGRLSPSLK